MFDYFVSNYKRIKFEEFESSVDYLNQKIVVVTTILEKTDLLTLDIEGLALLNLILELESFVKRKNNLNTKKTIIK